MLFRSLAKGLISFDGDPRSHQRPLGPVIKALESLGVSIGAGTFDHDQRCTAKFSTHHIRPSFIANCIRYLRYQIIHRENSDFDIVAYCGEGVVSYAQRWLLGSMQI